jgi:hypothetical protein
MQTVCFENVLLQVYAMQNCVDSVNAVYCEEKDPDKGLGGDHQLKQKRDNPK